MLGLLVPKHVSGMKLVPIALYSVVTTGHLSMQDSILFNLTGAEK
jgi:hypothetical protein